MMLNKNITSWVENLAPNLCLSSFRINIHVYNQVGDNENSFIITFTSLLLPDYHTLSTIATVELPQQYPLLCERCFSSTRRRSSLLAAKTLPSRWRRPGHMTVVSVELGERQHGRHACGVSKQIATLVQLTPPRRAIKNKNVVQKRKVGPSVPRTDGEGSMDGDNKLQFPTLPATKEELLVSVYVGDHSAAPCASLLTSARANVGDSAPHCSVV